MLSMLNQIDPHYGVYLGKVFQLAKTLVIKSETVIQQINAHDTSVKGHIFSQDPRTWRYYMNVCGLYHPIDLMKLGGKIKIVSMDTLEEIEFTTENLRKHKTTRKEYQYGTRKYEELITNYPEFETLILGILYPADMDKAINSPDGTILSYKPDLVEFNEYSFIEDLQRWIDGYKVRWTNSAYESSDVYYPIANLGVLYMNLVPAILMIRKRKCKTNEAHSYHVRQYLASHGFLDDYLDSLTTRQALRFYKNINYIERNTGKVSTFKWLTREVMTERRMPLAEYNMYHDNKDQIEDIYAKPVFKKKSLNKLEFITKEDDITTAQLLDKEEPLASYNHQYRVDNEHHIQRKLQNSQSDKLKTKVLESRVTDYSDAQVYRLSDTLLNLWLDWADKRIYRAVVNFNNFKTGERISLYPKDAFYVYFYCYWRWMGIRLEYVPELLAERVPILPIPNKDYLFKVVPIDGSLGLNEKYAVEDQFAEDIISLMPERPVDIISHEDFFIKAEEYNTAANLQYNLTAYEEEAHRRVYKEAMTHRVYTDRIISPASRTIGYDGKSPLLYEDYLNKLSLMFKNMTKEDWKKAAFAILNEATGRDTQNKINLRGLHAAMVRLMVQLSSYSVQYIKDVNEANILISGYATLRLTSPKETETGFYPVPHGLDILTQHDTEGSHLGNLLDRENFTDPKLSHWEGSAGKLDPTVQVRYESTPTTYLHVPTGIDVYYTPPNLKENERGNIAIPGMEDIANLPYYKQRQLKDVWGHDYYYKGICSDELSTKDPLEWALRRDWNGFEYYEEYERLILNKPLHGFDYDDKAPLRLDHDLDGFDYFDKELLTLDKPLIGFEYDEAVKLLLEKDLNGFEYDTQKTYLDLRRNLNGFEYENAPSLSLNKLLDGFEYDHGYTLILDKRLNGFGYTDNG